MRDGFFGCTHSNRARRVGILLEKPRNHCTNWSCYGRGNSTQTMQNTSHSSADVGNQILSPKAAQMQGVNTSGGKIQTISPKTRSAQAQVPYEQCRNYLAGVADGELQHYHCPVVHPQSMERPCSANMDFRQDPFMI